MAETKAKTTYVKGKLYQIPCGDLQTDPNQPRKFFDKAALEDLTASMEKEGVLQPVLFRVGESGEPILVAGERRLLAAKDAGLKTVPAILIEGNYTQIALMENLFREDLTVMEHAEALELVRLELDYTQEQLGIFIRKAKSTVSEILSLNELPDKIRKECRSNPLISRKALIAIAKKRPARMIAAYEKVKERMAATPKTRGPKGKRKNWQEKFSAKYSELTRVIADMDIEIMDAAERDSAIARIRELQKTTDNLINKITSTKYVAAEEKKVTKKKPVAKPPAGKVAKKKTVTKPTAKVPPKKKTAAVKKTKAK